MTGIDTGISVVADPGGGGQVATPHLPRKK